jgi:hypothetical protein
MVQNFCDEPYDNIPYGTLLFTLGCAATNDEGDPGGVGVYVNRGESPGGASPWIWITHKKPPRRGGFVNHTTLLPLFGLRSTESVRLHVEDRILLSPVSHWTTAR